MKAIVHNDKCQLTSMPKNVLAEDMQIKGEQVQNSDEIITKDQKKVSYSAKFFVSELTEADKVNMTATMKNQCKGKPVEKIHVENIKEEDFKTLEKGGFIKQTSLTRKIKSKKRRLITCSSTQVILHFQSHS